MTLTPGSNAVATTRTLNHPNIAAIHGLEKVRLKPDTTYEERFPQT